MKKCPYCAEEIQDKAIKCKHCRTDLKVTAQKTATANKVTDFMGFGCFLHGLALASLVLAMFTFSSMIGVFFGFLGLSLFWWGADKYQWRECSNCGTKLASKKVTECPSCGAMLKA